MYKALQVIDKATGCVLAEFFLLPGRSSQFSIEFGDGLSRLFVIRNGYNGAIVDSLPVGDKDVKIKILQKEF